MVTSRSALWVLSALAGTACAAFANFSISAVKTDQGGNDLVELYYFNNGQGGTGTALEAFEATYSGTPIQFAWRPGQPGQSGRVDIFNQSDDPALSWFRVHPERPAVTHAIPETSSPAWSAPIGNFRVTYATFELTPLPANTGPGVRFARLVLPDGGSFQLDTRVGGEIGPAVDADYTHFIANLAPVISGAGTLVSDRSGGTRTHRVMASDPDGLLTSFSVTDLDLAAAAGFDISRVDNGAFDVSWDPARVGIGDYRFALTAIDSSIQANNQSVDLLTIRIVPEPMSALLLAPLVLRRRR